MGSRGGVGRGKTKPPNQPINSKHMGLASPKCTWPQAGQPKAALEAIGANTRGWGVYQRGGQLQRSGNVNRGISRA